MRDRVEDLTGDIASLTARLSERRRRLVQLRDSGLLEEVLVGVNTAPVESNAPAPAAGVNWPLRVHRHIGPFTRGSPTLAVPSGVGPIPQITSLRSRNPSIERSSSGSAVVTSPDTVLAVSLLEPTQVVNVPQDAPEAIIPNDPSQRCPDANIDPSPTPNNLQPDTLQMNSLSSDSMFRRIGRNILSGIFAGFNRRGAN